MSFDNYANFAYTRVATPPSPALSGTTLGVTVTTGGLLPVAPFNAFVWPDSTQSTSDNCEIIRVTALTADTLTFTRAAEGSIGRAIQAGDQIAAGPTVKTITDLEAAINANGAAITALKTGAIAAGGLTPTKFAFNGGVLQKQDPGSSTWTNFTIKGVNFGPTPPGFNPNSARPYDAMGNLAQVKWFAEHFSAAGGNSIRVYFNYFSNSGSQGVMGQSNINQWRKALDIFYANGIYVLVDSYVNFFSSYNTAALTAWYQNAKAQEMISAADFLGDHPAVMGYLFGNETNLGGNLASSGMNLATWWTYANTVGGEVKLRDPNHIVGLSSGINSSQSISDCLAAENGGLLSNFDFHGSNTYRGNGWVLPIEGNTDFFDQWVPTNNKPIIITETGVDAWNNTNGAIDEAAQATAAAGVWNAFNRTKCPGIFFFAAFDEIYKPGNNAGNPIQNGDNATIHGTQGYNAATDSFYMPNDLFANEQYFGWWSPINATPNMTPPIARAVVSTMHSTW